MTTWEGTVNPDQQLTLIVGIVGAVSGIVGAVVGSITGYILGQRRAVYDDRRYWQQRALAWSSSGRQEILRRGNLRRADLRDVDLGGDPDEEYKADDDPEMEHIFGPERSYVEIEQNTHTGADCSYCDFQEANLAGARLVGADLSHANMRKVYFEITALTYASLNSAYLFRAAI